jgi:tetratricopeptide (TPR) repeat protein
MASSHDEARPGDAGLVERSAARRRRRTWPWRSLVGLILVAAGGAGGWWYWESTRPPPTMTEIRILANQKRWPEVERALVRWLRQRPRDQDGLLMLGMTRLARGHEPEAREALERLDPRGMPWLSAQSILGELALKRLDVDAAERHFAAIADRDPAALVPRQRLIRLFSLQLRTAEVRERLWQIHAITRDPRTLIDLVLELFAPENDVRGMGPELEALVKANPENPRVRRAWGLAQLLRGEPRAALPHLEAAAAQLADDPAGRYALAECRMQLGEAPDPGWMGAGPPADTVAAARWWVLKGRLHEAAGQAAPAREAYERATALEPEDLEAHLRLGQMLARAGQKGPAQVHLELAESIRGRRNAVRREHDGLRKQGFQAAPELFERLGALCQAARLTAEAEAWFRHAIALEPARASAQEALAAARSAAVELPLYLPRPVLASGAAATTLATVPVRSQAAPAPPAAPAVRFEDIASASGLAVTYDAGARSDRLTLADTMGGGIGLFDFDADGHLDVYLVNGCPLTDAVAEAAARPNRLFRNRGDGTFEDVTARAGVAGQGYGMGCAVGDYDADGHLDLFVTGLRRTILYRNRGDGTFEDVTARAGVGSDRWTTAAGFGDLDGDGDLDLVVVTYVEDDPFGLRECRDQLGKPIHCSPKSYPAQADHLYRNNGDGTFTDVAEATGFVGPEGRGLGLAIADLDDDGRLDLFVANDASADFLFRNLGGLRFEEIGLAAGVALDGQGRATASMGVVADDLDQDGRLDLFHTNFLNEPNTLLRNLGQMQFQDVTLAAGLDAISMARTGFGTVSLDADHDGLADLFVANGHVDDQAHVNSPMSQLAQFFLGRPGGRFEETGASTGGYFRRPLVGRGVASGDLDNDGAVDLVVVHRDAPVAMLRNQTAGGGHWLGLDLRGARGAGPPVGTTIRVTAGGQTQMRQVTSGTSYLASSDPRIVMGLGPARRVDRLEVRWSSGTVQSVTPTGIDGYLRLEEQPPAQTNRPARIEPIDARPR